MYLLNKFSTVWGPPYRRSLGQTVPVAPPSTLPIPVSGTACSHTLLQWSHVYCLLCPISKCNYIVPNMSTLHANMMYNLYLLHVHWGACVMDVSLAYCIGTGTYGLVSRFY